MSTFFQGFEKRASGPETADQAETPAGPKNTDGPEAGRWDRAKAWVGEHPVAAGVGSLAAAAGLGAGAYKLLSRSGAVPAARRPVSGLLPAPAPRAQATVHGYDAKVREAALAARAKASGPRRGMHGTVIDVDKRAS